MDDFLKGICGLVLFGLAAWPVLMLGNWYNRQWIKKQEDRWWKNADDHARRMRSEERAEMPRKAESI